MTQRPLDGEGRHLLNHVEFVYAPGDRSLARALFEAMGFRVLDPACDPIPSNLGPAAAPYLIVYLDDQDTDVIDNVAYVSEVRPAQWKLETGFREHIAQDAQLAQSHAEFKDAYEALPQAMTHIGIAFHSPESIKDALSRIQANPIFANRVRLSPVYEPGGPGSLDDRIVQAFVYTDIVAAGLLCGGQQFELQVRLDGV